MIEAANLLSDVARRRPGIIENWESYRQSSFGLGHGRTRLGSGLRAVAPRCLNRENAGRTMTAVSCTALVWG